MTTIAPHAVTAPSSPLDGWTFPQVPDNEEFNPHVPGINGDGSPAILHMDAERGLTYTWHDISRRKQDWICRERGYLVSRVTVTDASGAEVGGLNITHTTAELVAAEMATPFHWADENTGTSFGFRYRDTTPQELWASAYTALGEHPPSMYGKGGWGLSASDAPTDARVLADELAHAEQEFAGQVQRFIEFLSVPFVDYAELNETAVGTDGKVTALRGTGVGRAMYVLAAKRLAEQGKVLRASGLQSDSAQALWKRLSDDPDVPTREVTVGHWKSSETSTHTCIDFTPNR